MKIRTGFGNYSYISNKEYDISNEYIDRLAEIKELLEESNQDPSKLTIDEAIGYFKRNPKKVPAYIDDIIFWRIALSFTGILIGICLFTAAFLAYNNQPVPDIFITASSTLIGVIAGLFAGNLSK